MLLLREWDLLQEQVVPRLLDVRSGQPRIWALDSVADAVAVTAAYRFANDGKGRLQAYASSTGIVSFSLSDIRCLPHRSRMQSFRRGTVGSGWVPGEALAEQVILAAPSEPVDLVTLNISGGNSVSQAVDQLRDGGLLLVAEPASDLSRLGSLEPLGPTGRLFSKRGSSGAGPARPAVEEPETLAVHQAREHLVVSHARLARSLARRFSHHGESKDDLEQVALLALVKAARRFDPSREISFSTFATASILGEIKRHFRDKTWMLRVPRSVQEAYLAVKEARDTLTHELSASPSIQQIAQRVGVSDEAVLEAMEAGDNYWPESLDVGVFEGEVGREIPVQDGGFDLSLERHQLAALLPRLAPRERVILKRIYFDGWTQRQVADEVGVSQMQVSRLLSRTIEKLREWAQE